ncbi:hypothetical protein OQA88_10674 [Cercophora sp. LCS_1]
MSAPQPISMGHVDPHLPVSFQEPQTHEPLRETIAPPPRFLRSGPGLKPDHENGLASSSLSPDATDNADRANSQNPSLSPYFRAKVNREIQKIADDPAIDDFGKMKEIARLVKANMGVRPRVTLLCLQSPDGANPANAAAEKDGDKGMEVLKYLAMEGVFDDAHDRSDLLENRPKRKGIDTPLLRACKNGNSIQLVDYLVYLGTDLRARTTEKGWNVIHCAAAARAGDGAGAGLIKYFGTLIQSKDLDMEDFMSPATNDNNNTPAHLAGDASLFDADAPGGRKRRKTFDALVQITERDCLARINGDGCQPTGRATEAQKAKFRELEAEVGQT